MAVVCLDRLSSCVLIYMELRPTNSVLKPSHVDKQQKKKSCELEYALKAQKTMASLSIEGETTHYTRLATPVEQI